MNFWQRHQLMSLTKKVEKMHQLRLQQNDSADAIKNEIKAQYELASFYKKHRYDKKLPRAESHELECYRAAAELGDARAYYIYGERLLTEARFWDNWSRHPIYGHEVNKMRAADIFKRAFESLHEAENRGYPLAKRLLGLAHINGWGMPKNMDEGFKLILESIDQEKAWDRATKIFEELKLNSPEFFAALRSYKGGAT